jgi:hypothetical protein
MKPSALRIERLLAKVEAESRARPRRYCFHPDEVAEAEAQGLPYVLVPRVLSREEWEKKYCQGPARCGLARAVGGTVRPSAFGPPRIRRGRLRSVDRDPVQLAHWTAHSFKKDVGRQTRY